MAKPTWCFDATQYVCSTMPSARLKSALDDDRFASLHSFQSRTNSSSIDTYAINKGDRNSFSLQMVNEPPFVLCAPFRKRLKSRIPYLWFLQFSIGHLEIELG
ncbi:hypothetical protein AC630_37670 [Bradyrhizobium sp. AS23.2]|nr:hypothetical protein AC630_37670 [Bradyrhizobium sp. AS23.2]